MDAAQIEASQLEKGDRQSRIDSTRSWARRLSGPRVFVARTRCVAASASIIAMTLQLAACSSSNGSTPVRETASVRKAENIIGSYAAKNGGGAETGRPAACEVRIIGEDGKATARREYAELLCSHLSGAPLCERKDSAFLVQAVATMTDQRTVTSLLINDDEDAGVYAWVRQHFPARWQSVEQAGPQYGDLLDRRLRARYPCR